MDTSCVELLLRDGRKISIDCTGVEDVLNVTMAQQTELDYLIYNDPLGYPYKNIIVIILPQISTNINSAIRIARDFVKAVEPP